MQAGDLKGGKKHRIDRVSQSPFRVHLIQTILTEKQDPGPWSETEKNSSQRLVYLFILQV